MIRRWSLMAALFAAFTLVSVAQEDGFLKKAPNPGEARVRVNEMRDGRRQVLKGVEEAKNKADLLVMAKSLMYPVTEPQFYLPPEPNPKKPSELAPVPSELRFDTRLEDLDKYVLKPGPNSKLDFNQYDFLIEIGAAYDATLKELLKPEAPVHVRVNTARMLALVAKSGAPAHAGMITELIANPATPPEILNYALQAAGNLLAAYDPRLAGGLTAGNHTIKEGELVKLLQALETVINRQTPYGPVKAAKPVAAPPAVGIVKEAPKDAPKKDEKAPATKKDEKALPGKTGGKIEATPVEAFDEEQARVIRYLRRHAIRALSQIRQPMVLDGKSNTTARPLFILCRIAVNDGPFAPPLGPEEYADAVLGLANLHSVRGVDVDVVANCMAIGARNFAGMKATTTGGVTLWKTYGGKFLATFASLQKLLTETASMQSAGPKLNPLIALIVAKIATPLDSLSKTNTTAAGLSINEINEWLNGRTVKDMVPYTDLQGADKTKLTLRPVDPK